ncbi:ABC transporter substrate-binding protein [Hydrogenophaga laconesensis]|uniref:Branched-chain amino acid transport system substrate-binding protein n=1 Tax=Hydrogenophaga laconesensis TaxID=1805971 RepID=A0ABU1VBE2_9BURK|nr:ABC transporter substrate-binding protein [Hydrogenophaga laconesensis]MDR7094765.1 branched-chain amino acid transport system substrate-binding protein [Hydrogenophaga laconesensis]
MNALKNWAARAAIVAGAATSALSPATAQTVYQVPALSDYSGPFAAIMPMLGPGRDGVVAWWNAEVGSKLNVKLELKTYDTRYDTAQTASLWPGVLATKPVIGLSLGGPDTSALQQRLPTDKVPMILGSAATGFGWRPNQWVMATRPTFVHEVTGFVEWFQKNKAGGTRPVKVAMFTTEASPTFADLGKGVTAYAKANPSIVNLVEMVYVEPQPADVTLQLRRVLNAGAELVLVPTNIQQAVAVKRAMQALGKNVPIAYSIQNSPAMLQKLVGSMEAMNGDYEVHAGVIATEEASEAKQFYDMLVARYGLKAPWHSITTIGMSQALVMVRVVEAAAKKHGGDKLTGEILYNTLLETHFPAKDFYGFTGGGDIDFSVEAPFPTKDPRVNIGQVVGGKLTTVAKGVPVPRLAKW